MVTLKLHSCLLVLLFLDLFLRLQVFETLLEVLDVQFLLALNFFELQFVRRLAFLQFRLNFLPCLSQVQLQFVLLPLPHKHFLLRN